MIVNVTKGFITYRHIYGLICSLALLCVGCQSNHCSLEPNFCYIPQQRLIQRLPSPFEPLSPQELDQDWGKELFIGRAFARELDLYRAITCFKRSLLLLPSKANRKREIEYDIFLAYYMGNKYQDAIDAFDASGLLDTPLDFPAFQDLLITLYDAYQQVGQPEKAYKILCLIASTDEEKSKALSLAGAVIEADFPMIDQIAPSTPAGKTITSFIIDFQSDAKSVRKARTLNAILPGAGYYYVGQKKSALTSFLINTLFIAAAYQLFDRGYIAAGIITASLETGWYFGGINGAGLEAKEFNERLYETLGKEALIKERLFPILMINKGF
ncbi:MAG: tetratricopeptide repeat protein [Parachlamydiaceae bacterium]|nr:tetratricopeptide repeat protein [Parachlamydiaceae bacterium]